MKLTAYALCDHSFPKIVPAPRKRDWMPVAMNRCLPLTISNSYGWEILNDNAFTAIWGGGNTKDDIVVVYDNPEHETGLACSHFGLGVLTFGFRVLFQTEPGWDMMVTGPSNRPKDSISPLEGVVETDWLAATFTMNWQFTRPHTPIRFEADEPVCRIYPVLHRGLEQVEPTIMPISSNPELQRRHQAWGESRGAFNKRFDEGDPETLKQGWQRDYFQGKNVGCPVEHGALDHVTKLKLRSFE